MLKRLFEQEVPEIYDGVVEIISIAREAGDRSKIAVRSRDVNVDPVGTCVGPRGQRVQAIVNELKGENMDIVKWDEDPAQYIANALNPAQVVHVDFEPAKGSCTVVVPDYQLSLAIGKRGQNARLAAKLTGFKIDIKSETDYHRMLIASDLAVEETEEFIEELEEATEAEQILEMDEIGENILDADEVEELISEVELDPEQDYSELLEESEQ